MLRCMAPDHRVRRIRVGAPHQTAAGMIFSILRWAAWIRRRLAIASGRNRTIYVKDRRDEYIALWRNAATAIGATCGPLSEEVCEITLGDRKTRVLTYLVQFDDPVVLGLAGDKAFCYGVADRLGIPTPEPRTLDRTALGRAWRSLSLDGAPLVVKPAEGTGSGVGVSIDVGSRYALAEALALASLFADRVVVERMVPAESVRLLFLDGQMIHAVRRSGVRIVGDGRSTIRRLLNAQGVSVDLRIRQTLARQGLTPEDIVPADGSIVARWVRPSSVSSHEERTVYDEDVTALVGRPLIDEVAPLVSAIGTRFAGVDLLTNDPTRSLAESGGVFLEVNTTPGLHHHCRPATGGSCAVAESVLRALLDEPAA